MPIYKPVRFCVSQQNENTRVMNQIKSVELHPELSAAIQWQHTLGTAAWC